MTITGKDLIGWGFDPGPWFTEALARVNRMRANGDDDRRIIGYLTNQQPAPSITLRDPNTGPSYNIMLDATTTDEITNRFKVELDMDALMRCPTVVAGAVMPDACPAGVIPVGGVVATENAIHPGFHSADICCSVMMTLLDPYVDEKKLLDAAHLTTHFGPVSKDRRAPFEIDFGFDRNKFLRGIDPVAHIGTQGDGNHFLYVGRLSSTGEVAIVTHHGSRGPGAQLYKRGMIAARRHTAKVAPEVTEAMSWIEADSDDGQEYWAALQLIREWTRFNHAWIHNRAIMALPRKSEVQKRIWNEHNFVFQKSDGLFYHAKGATPNWAGYAHDDSGLTLIPLNMAEPILIVEHTNNRESLGFAPHGAGRNFSRRQHLRQSGDLSQELVDLQAHGLDIRAYSGTQDWSELPSAYKDARSVMEQIEKYNIGRVVDTIQPYGSIMAGHIDWRKER